MPRDAAFVVKTATTEVWDLLKSEENKTDPFFRCESPSLRLEKFVRLGGTTKGEEVRSVVNCQQRNGREIPLCKPRGAETFRATLEASLIVNQAGGILENAGMCLHRHFGTPFIPGSAVKGAARHAAWVAWKAEKDPEQKAKLAKEIAHLFGYPTNEKGLDAYLAEMGWKEATAGTICFMAAVPEGTAKLGVDIVNCHHKEYYAGNRPEAVDDEAPIPNYFPSVQKGVRFVFTLIPIRGEKNALESAKKWLVEAITLQGMGAKTAAGYGWFSVDFEADRREEERQKEMAEEKRRREEDARLAAEKEEQVQKRKEKRASMTDEDFCIEILEKWKTEQKGEVKRVVKSGYIKQFDKQPENYKKGIVLALRQETGLGADVWKELKPGQKGDIAKGVNDIRAFCKNEMNLGKMP